ncbi:hypothetical protein D1AOALGA4SA_9086 [Olavius algarvensis Delta 1 endosymbiont]|nr:hypothetical protein D1AOALGA4SA_9086 [Olavius algarvensis Delta 1 endosymbiont]
MHSAIQSNAAFDLYWLIIVSAFYKLLVALGAGDARALGNPSRIIKKLIMGEILIK